MYIHANDVANLAGESESSSRPKVIINGENTRGNHSEKTSYNAQTRETSSAVVDAQSRATLEKIYLDLRSELKAKDQTIQDLSIRLGQAQEIAKNSVSLVEFKKSQFLLEESK